MQLGSCQLWWCGCAALVAHTGCNSCTRPTSKTAYMLGMFTQPQGGHGCCADSMTSAPRMIAANPQVSFLRATSYLPSCIYCFKVLPCNNQQHTYWPTSNAWPIYM